MWSTTSGWHAYTYDATKYPCLGADDDCGSPASPAARAGNYYRCPPCQTISYFESTISSLNADDITRAEAARRLSLSTALPVHKEMRKVHKVFCAKGGCIRPLVNACERPTVLWDDYGIVRGVTAAAKPAR